MYRPSGIGKTTDVFERLCEVAESDQEQEMQLIDPKGESEH
jgi:hypothetical protein